MGVDPVGGARAAPPPPPPPKPPARTPTAAPSSTTAGKTDANPGRKDSESGSGAPTAVIAGRSGAAGRDAFVATQTNRAFQLGRTTPTVPYNQSVLRLAGQSWYPSYNDHTRSSPGRYNSPGQSTLYNSESFRGVEVEARNYAGLNGRTVVRSDFTGNVVDAANIPGLRPSALTEPFGNQGAMRTPLTRITGEDPYTIPRALSDGVRAQGADGIRVPAHGGVTHLNIFPENTRNFSGAYNYVDHQNISSTGTVSGRLFNPNVQLPPAGSIPNGNLGNPGVLAADNAAHSRAGGARYGAAGSFGVSTIQALSDGNLSGQDVANIAGSTALGTGSAVASDLLTPRLGGGLPGGFRAGAVVDAAVTAPLSAWQNAGEFQAGRMTSGQATADVVVDTGVAVSAGLTGMAAGAAIGSVVPIAGTAVGAVVGFGVGVAASWATSTALEGSGLANWAREGLGRVLDNNFQQPLNSAWNNISSATDAIGSTASSAWNSASNFVGGLFGR